MKNTMRLLVFGLLLSCISKIDAMEAEKAAPAAAIAKMANKAATILSAPTAKPADSSTVSVQARIVPISVSAAAVPATAAPAAVAVTTKSEKKIAKEQEGTKGKTEGTDTDEVAADTEVSSVILASQSDVSSDSGAGVGVGAAAATSAAVISPKVLSALEQLAVETGSRELFDAANGLISLGKVPMHTRKLSPAKKHSGLGRRPEREAFQDFSISFIDSSIFKI